MEVRGGGPDAVQRRSLVARRPAKQLAVHEPAVLLLAEPRLGIRLPVLHADRCVAVRISPDLVQRDHLVRVRPLAAIGAVARRAILAEQHLAPLGLLRIDGERVLRRFEAEQVLLDVAEGRFGLGEGFGAIQRMHHELHQRPHRARVRGTGVIHGAFLLHEPPRRHVRTGVVAEAEVHVLAAEREVGVAEAEQVDAEAVRFVGAAHVAEGEWRLRQAIHHVEVFKQGLEIERSVAEADVALAEHGAAVAEHAVHADAVVEESLRLAEAHRHWPGGVWGFVQAVAIAEGFGVVRGPFLHAGPRFPSVAHHVPLPERGNERGLLQSLPAAFGRCLFRS